MKIVIDVINKGTFSLDNDNMIELHGKDSQLKKLHYDLLIKILTTIV